MSETGWAARLQPLWGEWQVETLLGEGSSGRVWKVRRETNRGPEYAAVKEMVIAVNEDVLRQARGEGLDPEGARRYFRAALEESRKEAALMRELAGCGAVAFCGGELVHEFREEDCFGWVLLLRMELLTPLEERILEGGLTLADAVRLALDLCGALEACEERGIVHRDIKPENLFYSPETDTYKLGDFGIAHALKSPTQEQGGAGTLTHLPPEVYQGAPYTAAADRYALGMVLYRLLNDNRVPLLPPYPAPYTPADRGRALMMRLRGAEPEEPSIVRYAGRPGPLETGLGVRFREEERERAAALGRLAQKAVSARPEDRFPSAAALRAALEQLIS